MAVVVRIAVQHRQRQAGAGEDEPDLVFAGIGAGRVTEEATRRFFALDEGHPPGCPEVLHRLNHRSRSPRIRRGTTTKPCILRGGLPSRTVRAARLLNLTLDPR